MKNRPIYVRVTRHVSLKSLTHRFRDDIRLFTLYRNVIRIRFIRHRNVIMAISSRLFWNPDGDIWNLFDDDNDDDHRETLANENLVVFLVTHEDPVPYNRIKHNIMYYTSVSASYRNFTSVARRHHDFSNVQVPPPLLAFVIP